ncbi:PREDICTED: nucleolar protein 58-like isoform X2 [Dinoponera quadriceps]|uniref:Nucleolar protein 58-like isoform X2 n=1 Tax=Dinoponera quadriceps TaxID=609295 RepID=A0A6P3XXH6_DINQU|nr:PREDICTED: nucleolar protein 58-like isoform X2 [Dinoponera quadriceps]
MSKIEYRAVIKFLTKEGFSPSIIKERLDGVYGEASPSYSTVKEWAKQFRLGRESIKDDPRKGLPVEVMTEQNMSLVEEELLNDEQLKLREISAKLGLSKSTVFRIIHEKLLTKKTENNNIDKVDNKRKRESDTIDIADVLVKSEEIIIKMEYPETLSPKDEKKENKRKKKRKEKLCAENKGSTIMESDISVKEEREEIDEEPKDEKKENKGKERRKDKQCAERYLYKERKR